MDKSRISVYKYRRKSSKPHCGISKKKRRKMEMVDEKKFEVLATDLLTAINKQPDNDPSSETAKFAEALLGLVDRILMGKIALELATQGLNRTTSIMLMPNNFVDEQPEPWEGEPVADKNGRITFVDRPSSVNRSEEEPRQLEESGIFAPPPIG